MNTNQSPVPEGITPVNAIDGEPEDTDNTKELEANAIEQHHPKPSSRRFTIIVTTMDLAAEHWRDPNAYYEEVEADSPEHAQRLAEQFAFELACGAITDLKDEAAGLSFAEVRAMLVAHGFHLSFQLEPMSCEPADPCVPPSALTKFLVSVPIVDMPDIDTGIGPEVINGILEAATLEEAFERANHFALREARSWPGWVDEADGQPFETAQIALWENGFYLGDPRVRALADIALIPAPTAADSCRGPIGSESKPAPSPLKGGLMTSISEPTTTNAKGTT